MSKSPLSRRAFLRSIALGAAFVVPATLVGSARLTEVGASVQVNKYGDISLVRYDAEPVSASINASWRTFPSGATTVYLANPQDLLVVAGIVAAGGSTYSGPVLYVNADGTLPELTTAEIGRLKPTRIVALGGQGHVQTETVDKAREIAAEAIANTSQTDTPVTVETDVWEGTGPISSSIRIARGLFPEGASTTYLVQSNTENTMALAAIAGTMGNGPVLVVDSDSTESLQVAIDELNPEFVVAVGAVDSAIVDDLSRDRKKSLMSGSSVRSIALNASSTRTLEKNSTAVVVSIFDPASLVLGAEIATGPLIPVAPETLIEAVNASVLSAAKLSGASAQRYVAIGEKGEDSRIFSYRKPETLSGGLTSLDVVGKGQGSATLIEPPNDLPTASGRTFTYRLRIEDGLPVDADEFARIVATILNDPRGWGYNFTQVTGDADTTITLASGSLVDDLCAPLPTHGQTSCNNGANTVINIERWAFGSTPFMQAGGTIEQYRGYVIGHEVGHALGHGHAPSPGRGELAPVMLQQTLDLQGCLPNPWPNPEA
ncbi:MAG: DUF3152 domain-containing protein [Actinomycetaceae bacterium]|nr:DUF3152 domain-containing protein [Actinomycetaceae bacterium]